MKNFTRRVAPSPTTLLCLMATVCIPSMVSAQVTTPVTAGSGQTVSIPTNQSIHVPTGNAISATAGGTISGTGITAITDGDTAAVNASGAGSLISLNGNTILTGARGGAWMASGGLVKLGGGTIINVTGSSAGSAGIYVNGPTAPAGTFGSGITININGTHANTGATTPAWIGAVVQGTNASASFDNLTVQGASADIGAMATQGGTINLTNSNITVNGRIPGADLSLWPIGVIFATVTSMGLAAHSSGHLTVSGTNVTVTTPGSGVVMGIAVTGDSTLDLRNSTISMTGTITAGTAIAAGLYTSLGSSNVITISNSRILTAGNNFQGIYAGGGTITADALSIATAGSQSYGIHFTSSRSTVVTIGNSDITTSGADSIGVRVNSVNAVANFTNSTIAAQGANNIGVAVTTDGGNANLTMSGGALTSTSTALQVQDSNATFGFSNGVTVTSGNGLLLDVQGAGNAALTASTGAKLTGDIQAATLNNATVALDTNASWTGVARNVGSVTMSASSTWTGSASNTGAVAVSGGSLWNLTDSSDVASLSLDNSTVAFEAPHSPFKTLTVHGDYTGNNGLIVLNTQLGDDASPTDRLVVQGNTSGTSLLQIVNSNGGGALTTGNGINVVQVQGNSAGTFALSDRVAAGAFDYNLFHGAADGSAGDGNWYLRSTILAPSDGGGLEPVPNVRPEVPTDAVIPALAIEYGYAMLNIPDISGMRNINGDLGRLQPQDQAYEERSVGCPTDGNRKTASALRKQRQCIVRVPVAAKASPWFPGAWGRLIGERGLRDTGNFFRRGPDYNYTFGGIQAGLDVYGRQQADGALDRAGVYVGYGQIASDVKGVLGTKAGSVDMDAYTVGGYWRHQSPVGWYTNAIVQGTFYSTDAKSVYGQQVKPDGWGLLASLEGGYAFKLGNGLTLEPQAQIAYQTVSFDDTRDSFGRFAFGDNNSFRGRLGARLSKLWNIGDAAKPRLLDTWLRLNVWHEFSGDNKLTVTALNGANPMVLSSSLAGTWGEIEAGVSGQISDKVSVFGAAGYSHSLDNRGQQSWNGRIGISARW